MDYWCEFVQAHFWSDEDEIRWNEDQLMEEYDNEEDDSVVEGEWWTRWEGAKPGINQPG